MKPWLDEVHRKAIVDMWANPHVDKQFTVKPVRITTVHGDTGQVSLPFKTVGLPKPNVRYVVYIMGQLDPRYFGFDDTLLNWNRLDTLCIDNKMLAYAFTDYRLIPASTIWVRRHTHKDFVIAIEHHGNSRLLQQNNPVYLRFYSNGYFNTPEGGELSAIDIKGGVIGSSVTVSEAVTAWQTFNARPVGKALAFVDGFYTNMLLPNMLASGSTCEVIHDGSMIDYFDVPIDNTSFFSSEVDGLRKAILMAPDRFKGSFYYQDDIEIFACNTVTENGSTFVRGAYFSRMQFRDVRQLTQQDWAVYYNKFTEIVLEQDSKIRFAGSFFRVYLRKSTGPIPFALDGNYSADLMLLPFEERKRLLTGTGAVIPQWNAVNLEQSAFADFADNDGRELAYVQDIYSFYGIQKILEKPECIAPGEFTFPVTMSTGGAVFEYTVDGLLKRYRLLTTADYAGLYVTDADVTCVEFIPGRHQSNRALWDEVSLVRSDRYGAFDEMRMFKLPGQTWTLAQQGIHYNVVNGLIDWIPSYLGAQLLKRPADRFLLREIKIRNNGIGKLYPIFSDGLNTESGLPCSRVDIWMNKRRLVRGVGYIVKWPFFYIMDAAYRNLDIEENTIVILAHGVGNEIPRPQYGAVQKKLLSVDKTFNLHLHRNKTFIVDGRLVPEKDTAFAEGYAPHTNETGLLPDGLREGAIYGIEPMVSHFGISTKTATGTSAEVAQDETEELEAYLSTVYTQVPDPLPVIIPHKHMLVSITLVKMLEDYRAGKLVVTRQTYSKEAIAGLVQPYVSLLNLDVQKLDIHEGYVQIAAHGLIAVETVKVEFYSFLGAVNVNYFNGRVDLGQYFVIGG